MNLAGLGAEVASLRHALDQAWSAGAARWNDPVSARFAEERWPSLTAILDDAEQIIAEGDVAMEDALHALEALRP